MTNQNDFVKDQTAGSDTPVLSILWTQPPPPNSSVLPYQTHLAHLPPAHLAHSTPPPHSPGPPTPNSPGPLYPPILPTHLAHLTPPPTHLAHLPPTHLAHSTPPNSPPPPPPTTPSYHLAWSIYPPKKKTKKNNTYGPLTKLTCPLHPPPSLPPPPQHSSAPYPNSPATPTP